MAWGIDFETNIFLSRQEYKNTFQVEDAIKECQEELDINKTQIQMLGAATPKDITPIDQEPLYWINSEITNAFERIEEQCIKIYQLSLYLEYLQEQEAMLEQRDKVS